MPIPKLGKVDFDTNELLLSKEERTAREAARESHLAIRGELTGQGRFKLDLILTGERGRSKAYPGILTFWESAATLNGNGDIKIYLCPGRELRGNNCTAYIPSSCNMYGQVICPKCQSMWKPEELYGEVLGRHDDQGWARLLTIYFERFDRDCDLYMKYNPLDIQHAAELEKTGEGRGGDMYRKVEDGMVHVIYRHRSIITDARHTDTERVFFNFMRA